MSLVPADPAIAPDGATIEGRWETSPDGTEWTKDFDLAYERV